MAQMNQNGVAAQMGGNNNMLPNQQQVLGMQHASAQLTNPNANQNPNLGSPFNPNLAAAAAVAQSRTPVPRSGPTPQQNQVQQHQAQQQQQQQQQQIMQAIMQQRQQTSPQPPSGGSVGMGVGGPKPPMPMPQGMGQQVPRAGIAMPPIPGDKFYSMLQDSYHKQRINPNRPLLQIGARTIDLYQLHTEVLHFGGVANVSFRSLFIGICELMLTMRYAGKTT